MDKYLYPAHPVRCIITGPSECRKSFFLTNSNFHLINAIEKIYICSPTLHQDFCQKSNKRFSNYIPMKQISNILDEENLGAINYEVLYDIYFEKSNTEKGIYDWMKEIIYPQEFEGGIIFLVNLNKNNERSLD